MSKKLCISFLWLVWLSLGSPVTTFAQEKEKYEHLDTKREEIQRYFGYEELLYRYMSTPYDVNVNTTQSGNFVEVGYLFIFFIPVLLLLLFRRKPILYFSCLGYFIFLWIISTSNSFVFSHQKAKINTDITVLDSYLNEVPFELEPLDQIVGYFHRISLTLYKPFKSLASSISGDSDYITYPVLFLICIGVLLLLLNLLRNQNSIIRHFIVLTWLYLFYWLTFGGGIVWYGYILLPLLYFGIYLMMDKVKHYDDYSSKIVKGLFIGLGSFWILMASIDRVSNIQPNVPEEALGKGIFNPTFYDYGCGKMDYDGVIELLYPNLGNSLKQINADKDALVWRVGTSMTYFIDNNNERVVSDNQLGLFYPVAYTFPNKEELAEAIKLSNFKYFIVDLNTATIDLTPDKSLTKKFNLLMNFVRANPKVKLLATDRLVSFVENGETKYTYGLDGPIYYSGRYAIFQLI